MVLITHGSSMSPTRSIQDVVLILVLHCVLSVRGEHVPVASCVPSTGIPCGYSIREECRQNDCCWSDNPQPSCTKPEMRIWTSCSQECRHRGKPGNRRETSTGWELPCNRFPCHLQPACLCSRIDIVIILDASQKVSEPDFWSYKQFLMDLVTSYKQIGHDSHIALITYDSYHHTIFDFEADYSLDDVNSVVKAVWRLPFRPTGQTSNLQSALGAAGAMIGNQGRADVQHVVVVVSSGHVSRYWKLPDVAGKLMTSGAFIHAVHPGSLDGVDPNKKVLRSLTDSDFHVFTLADYYSRSALVTAMVTEWCCERSVQNAVTAIFDDEGDIYLNGEFLGHYTFRQTASFILEEKSRNLIAVRVDNTWNPLGRYFEMWNTAPQLPHGKTLLSLPYQWRCARGEKKGWYGLDYNDANWREPEIPERWKEQHHIGPRGQQRVWSTVGDWKSYCRGWTEELCNVTRMPGVTCAATETPFWFGQCNRAIDGVLSGRDREWITHNAKQPQLNITFAKPARIREVGLLNRCTFKGQVKDVRMTFSDGSVHEISLACNAYSPKMGACDGMDYAWMSFDPPIVSESIQIDVLSACYPPGKKKGLREVQVLGEPPCW